MTLAESGEQALEIMQPTHDFDLILLDWMMPGMTGLDVALAVRETKSPPKMVLLSSWNMPSSEHQAMVDVYEANGVRCHFAEADEGLPSSVFTRDSSFMTPWGAVIASVQTPPRRQDYSVVSTFYRNAGIPIWKWVTADHFEGGDFVIAKPGVALLGWAGDRSTKVGADQVAGWMRDQGWKAFIVPIPPQFVHMDAVVVMLEENLALVCEDALPDYAIDWLDRQGIERIVVPYADCVKLGGNIVSLGNRRILSMAHNININEKLQKQGFDVSAVEYDMFALGGGGVHCSCHELRRV